MNKFIEWASEKTLWIVIIPAFLVFGLTLAVPLYLSLQDGDWTVSYSDNGAVGDLFGGIMNPTIALLALVWLVKGVRLQQKELEETRRALQDSERHQAAQVKIAATTALLEAISAECERLNNYKSKCMQIHQRAVNSLQSFKESQGIYIDKNRVKELQGEIDSSKIDLRSAEDFLEDALSEKIEHLIRLKGFLKS